MQMHNTWLTKYYINIKIIKKIINILIIPELITLLINIIQYSQSLIIIITFH
jgi:hypothetical protein